MRPEELRVRIQEMHHKKTAKNIRAGSLPSQSSVESETTTLDLSGH
jgi:hypothetical protein